MCLFEYPDFIPLIDGRASEHHEYLVWLGLESVSWGYQRELRAPEGPGVRAKEPGSWTVVSGDWLLRFTGTVIPGIYSDAPEGIPPRLELYNIRSDPGERENLVEEETGVVTRLRSIGADWAEELPPPAVWRHDRWEELMASISCPQEPVESCQNRDQEKIYDPLLDPQCSIVELHGGQSPGLPPWNAAWMWYPGQYTAALNARLVQKSLKRCTHVGYPGNFTQLQPAVFFRAQARPDEASLIRWEGPSARTRLMIDGRGFDVTRREMSLQPGRRDIEAIVDFASGLPCLILDGAGVSSPAGWEVSLDGKTWTSPEYIEDHNHPEVLPGQPSEISVRIPVREVLHPVNVKIRDDAYEFGAGGEAVFISGTTNWKKSLPCMVRCPSRLYPQQGNAWDQSLITGLPELHFPA